MKITKTQIVAITGLLSILVIITIGVSAPALKENADISTNTDLNRTDHGAAAQRSSTLSSEPSLDHPKYLPWVPIAELGEEFRGDFEVTSTGISRAKVIYPMVDLETFRVSALDNGEATPYSKDLHHVYVFACLGLCEIYALPGVDAATFEVLRSSQGGFPYFKDKDHVFTCELGRDDACIPVAMPAADPASFAPAPTPREGFDAADRFHNYYKGKISS